MKRICFASTPIERRCFFAQLGVNNGKTFSRYVMHFERDKIKRVEFFRLFFACSFVVSAKRRRSSHSRYRLTLYKIFFSLSLLKQLNHSRIFSPRLSFFRLRAKAFKLKKRGKDFLRLADPREKEGNAVVVLLCSASFSHVWANKKRPRPTNLL